MRRGLLSGVIWGAVFAVMSLWLASQLGGVIRLLTTAPTNVVDQAPDSAVGDSAAPEDAPAVPAGEAFPATDPSRQGTTLASGQADSAPVAETEPAAKPQTGDVAQAIVQPQQGTAPTLDVAVDAPTLPGTAATGPAQPSADTSPVAAESAPQPAVAEPAGAMASLPEPAETDAPVGPAPDSSPAVSAEPGQPPVPSPGQSPRNDFSNPVVVEVPEPAPEPAPAPVHDPEPTAEPEASETVEISPAPAPGPAPTPDPQPTADAQQPATPETAENATVAEATGETGTMKPVTGIGAQVPNVSTNQLATVGGSAQVVEPETEPATEPASAEIATGPAIQMFAVDFDNPDRRPLMAIILLVNTDTADGADAAGPLPFPVSYAVDASAPEAFDLMRRYRNAGHEVLALAPLPERATPADVEVAFQAYLGAVPEAVAFMDTRVAAFQSGRFVATQIAAALAASGHGMVTYSRGLNSATQEAARVGVPAALVFREFDSADQDTATILRFLDQAAFRAGQQNGVILVGHNRAATITALREWSGGNRAGTVAMAQISVVLLGR